MIERDIEQENEEPRLASNKKHLPRISEEKCSIGFNEPINFRLENRLLLLSRDLTF